MLAAATRCAAQAGAGLAAAPGQEEAVGLAGQEEGLSGQSGGPARGLQQPLETSVDALALARRLMPTARLPTIEHNLPVIQGERYMLDAVALFLLVSE